MDVHVTERVTALMTDGRYSQKEFAKLCGLNYQNFNKYLRGKMPWSDRVIRHIADALKISKDWLSDGFGEKMRREKAIGEAQFAEAAQWITDANVVNNTIHGENNSGTQTIQTATKGAEVELLKQKVAMLEKLLNEKDKQIDFLQGLVKGQQP